MTSHRQRWPIWKIAAATLVCLIAAIVLFVLSVHAAPQDTSPDAARQEPLITLPTFLLMLGMLGSMLTVLGAGWLAYRIKDARTPAWEKRPRRTRRKRR